MTKVVVNETTIWKREQKPFSFFHTQSLSLSLTFWQISVIFRIIYCCWNWEAESICANNSNLAATTPSLTQIPRSVLTVSQEINMFPLKWTCKKLNDFFTLLPKPYSETNNTIRNIILLYFRYEFDWKHYLLEVRCKHVHPVFFKRQLTLKKI